jgi:hypothetical protein
MVFPINAFETATLEVANLKGRVKAVKAHASLIETT